MTGRAPFPLEFLDMLRARLPLRQAIGETVKLTKSGHTWKGRCCFHAEKTPSLVVYPDGFKCFGCGEHGDLFDFIGKRLGIEFPDSVQHVATRCGVPMPDTFGPKHLALVPKPNPDWKPMVPVPADAIKPTADQLRCDVLYDYRGPAGELLHYVKRFEKRGSGRKAFVPLTYGVKEGRVGWHENRMNAPLPLYRLNALAENPDAPVLLCEGEKSCLAAQGLFPDHVVVAWQGGANNDHQADLTPLLRRQVVIWPDNDSMGLAAAKQIAGRLPGAVVLRVDDLAPGGDAADIQPDDPAAWLRDHVPPAPRGLLTVLRPAEIAREQARPYVVKGLIARGDNIIGMGHPGSGKSVVAPYIGYAVAQGLPVFGRRVHGGPVIYFASEDGAGMKNRVRALLARHGDAPDFHLVPMPVDLLNDGPSRQAAMALVAALRPVLVIVDTLGRSFPGLRENDSDDMGRVIGAIREMALTCDSAIWTLHHQPKDGFTPRGHGSLDGDADLTLRIEGTGSETRRIVLGKNRNGASDLTLAFTIEVAELGLDEDGDPITAPLATEADLAAIGPGRESRLSDKPALLLRLLQNADPRDFEDRSPAPGVPVCRVLARETFRRRLIADGWFPEHLLCADAKLERGAYGMEHNNLNALRRRGFLNFNRAWVWLS